MKLVREYLKSDLTIDLTTFGRRTQAPRSVEIWLLAIDDRFFITGTSGRRDWFANLRSDARLLVGLKRWGDLVLGGRARIIEDEIERGLVLRHPAAEWYRRQQRLELLLAEAPVVEVVFD